MNWIIPGTTLTAQREDTGSLQPQFEAMFLCGGISLRQVTDVTGLDPYLIQNWVKRGYLSNPVRKRYSLNQLSRIITIGMLRGVLSMERICALLSYVNGKLDDEDDDLISDAELYVLVLQLAAQARDLDTLDQWNQALEATLAHYVEPAPGARQRVMEVLRIMLTAWVASRMAQEADKMMATLELPKKEA